jgi:hypothetical protein
MTPAHIAAWRDYLAEQLHQQCGIARRDARRQVTHWLGLLQQEAAPPAYEVAETPPVRDSHARPATRTARA